MVYVWVFVLLLAMGVFEGSMSFGVLTLAFVSGFEFVCCAFIFCMGVVCWGACSFVYVGCLSWFVLFDFVCWCVIVNIRWLFVRLGLLFLLCFWGCLCTRWVLFVLAHAYSCFIGWIMLVCTLLLLLVWVGWFWVWGSCWGVAGFFPFVSLGVLAGFCVLFTYLR